MTCLHWCGFSESHEPDIYINNMKELGGPFEELIDLEPIIPLVREMVGTRIRLNHDYGIMRRHADGRTPFHLGNTPVRPSCQFRVHNGEFYSTLVKGSVSADRPGDRGWLFLGHPGQPQEQLPESVWDRAGRYSGARAGAVPRRGRDHLHGGDDARLGTEAHRASPAHAVLCL